MKRMLGAPTVMRKFLVLMLGIALLWFFVIVIWINSDGNSNNKSLQIHDMHADDDVSSIEQTQNNLILDSPQQHQRHQQQITPKSIQTQKTEQKIVLVSTMKSSKLSKQVQLLLGSARIEFDVVAGGVKDVVLKLIDRTGDLLADEELLIVFPNTIVYYTILCRSPEFFQTRFKKPVKVLTLTDTDEELATQKHFDVASYPHCMPFTVGFADNITAVNMMHDTDADDDAGNVFQIFRRLPNEFATPLSLYDSTPMKLAFPMLFHEQKHEWRKNLCFDIQQREAGGSSLCQNDALLLIHVDDDDPRQSTTSVNSAILSVNLDYWWSQIALLDLIGYFSPQNRLTLDRYLLVDIDDGFIGPVGSKMTEPDIRALIAEQEHLRTIVKNFRFNIGFSASPKFFHTGTPDEIAGDDMLIAERKNFWWFPHMYDHMQPHLFNDTGELVKRMLKNYHFAQKHDIELVAGYAVAPHHSGVYPVHKPLYDAWRRVYNISVTTTEEYPHIKPFLLHRGFQHRNISVLPRQVCGLYTKILHYSDFQGGLAGLNRTIFGGGNSIGAPQMDLSLFTTLLTKPVLNFMTHMVNYANDDRIALYTFREALQFITQKTNLRFETVKPTTLAELYFNKFYPHDQQPVWSNPCDDKRHREIWPRTSIVNDSHTEEEAQLACDNLSLPDFIILGPQKTGTTALYTFLAQHPALASNIPNPTTFEEVQFFSNDTRYIDLGVEWYLRQFPQNSEKLWPLAVKDGESMVNGSLNYQQYARARLLYEKSATYFDAAKLPVRVHALLPRAKLIVVMADPVKRAYSWYLHQRDHKDAAALHYSFQNVVNFALNRSSPTTTAEIRDSGPAAKRLRFLAERCVEPGKYAVYLRRWLRLYPASQLLLLDAGELQHDPVSVMNKVQKFLQLTPLLDYNTLVRYNSKKQFFCPRVAVNSSQTKCLGTSKGRSTHSEPISPRAEFALRSFYRQFNVQLYDLLQQIRAEVPEWLRISVGAEAVTTTPSMPQAA